MHQEYIDICMMILCNTSNQYRGDMKPEIKPRLLTVKAAAKELGLSIWTLRVWAYSGRISSHKVGNRLMIAPSEIDRIVSESERPRRAE